MVSDDSHKPSTLDKIKTLLTPSRPSSPTSPHDDSSPNGHSHAVGGDGLSDLRDAHEQAEQKADELIHEREVEQAQTTTSPTTPVDPRVTHLSSLKHRPSLEVLAKGAAFDPDAPTTVPDLQGVTHIPESELPVRWERKEHTALRPNDMSDPNSMDGKPEPSTAGDDWAI